MAARKKATKRSPRPQAGGGPAGGGGDDKLDLLMGMVRDLGQDVAAIRTRVEAMEPKLDALAGDVASIKSIMIKDSKMQNVRLDDHEERITRLEGGAPPPQ